MTDTPDTVVVIGEDGSAFVPEDIQAQFEAVSAAISKTVRTEEPIAAIPIAVDRSLKLSAFDAGGDAVVVADLDKRQLPIAIGVVGQSQAQRTAPVEVVMTTDDPPFGPTPPHDAATVVDAAGVRTVTFEGKTDAKVTWWYPSENDLRAVTAGVEPFASGLNAVGLGAAVGLSERLGRDVVGTTIARGAQPLERFVESSVYTITGVTLGNPVIVSIDDATWLPHESLLDFLPIRFEGVGGATWLNSGTWRAARHTPSFDTTRYATGPVAGSIALYDDAGVAVNGAGRAAWTSGGSMVAHDLLDQMRVDVPAMLAAANLDTLDVVLAFIGEAHGGATAIDTRTTVGGIATAEGHLDRCLEFIRQCRGETWCRPDTRFVFMQLLHDDANADEKPGNRVIDVLPDHDPFVSVAACTGYVNEPLDTEPTHVADRWGLGYHSGSATLAGSLTRGERGLSPVSSWYDRRVRHPNGGVGQRPLTIQLDQQHLDWSDKKASAPWFAGASISARSSLIDLPSADDFTSWDVGLNFTLHQWSITGTTPVVGGGHTVVRATGVTFKNTETDVDTVGSVTLTDTHRSVTFRMYRTDQIHLEFPSVDKAIAIADVTGLQTALDGKAATSHTHANATTATSGFMSATDKTKLDGVASGATANFSDAWLLSRSNHTGSQATSTITGLDTALAGKVDTSRTVSASTGLTGGGALSANLTFSFDTTWGDARYGRLGAANSWTGTQTFSSTMTFNGTTTNFNGAATYFTGASTSASAANAYLDGSNRIWKSTSSLRYKRDVRDLDLVEASRVLDFRPVKYRSKSEADDPNADFIGLIAEEVDAIDPRFVTRAEVEGEVVPDGVQYDRVVIPLLRVVQDMAERLRLLEQALAAR
jgi:hypothetical protein